MEQPYLDFDNLYQEYQRTDWGSLTETERKEWDVKLKSLRLLWNKLCEKQQNTFDFFDGLLPF